MKIVAIASALFAVLFAPLAMAQSAEPLIVGGKIGFMKPHGSDNDSGMTIGASMGKRIEGNFRWEADLMLGVSDGEIGRTTDWSVDSIAGYGVYQTSGNVYFKAKAGVAYWDDNFDNDTNLSMGVGIGAKMGRGALEFEYTQLNDYTDYITVGYSVPF